MSRPINLVNESGTVIARGDVIDEGTHFGGTIDLSSTPAPVRAVFNEFEEIVSGQVFSLLDAIEDKIVALRLRVVFDDGTIPDIYDLQVYPETGDMSFRLTERRAFATTSINGTQNAPTSPPEQVPPNDRTV